MGETIAAFDASGFKAVYIRELDNQIHVLCEALGSCERIAKTPLPTGFSRHSSRLLFMWSNSLPFALYPLMGPIATLPTALLTAYAVLGIEDISVQLEEPFDILPMRQYGDGMFDSIRAIEQGYDRPSSSYTSSRKGE
jgi:predicted membrane chloride channel (bestrophin family)